MSSRITIAFITSLSGKPKVEMAFCRFSRQSILTGRALGRPESLERLSRSYKVMLARHWTLNVPTRDSESLLLGFEEVFHYPEFMLQLGSGESQLATIRMECDTTKTLVRKTCADRFTTVNGDSPEFL